MTNEYVNTVLACKEGLGQCFDAFQLNLKFNFDDISVDCELSYEPTRTVMLEKLVSFIRLTENEAIHFSLKTRFRQFQVVLM
jgi:hypothetical protein